MTSCRLLLWAFASILSCQLFVLPSSQFAQPRPKLSSAQEQLQAAVENLDAAAIREAVRAGADPNYRYGGRGRSLLGIVGAKQLVSLRGQVGAETEERLITVYDVLFETGARLGPYDADILHVPAIRGAARVAKYLLERGANPNGEDGDGNTPIILATRFGHPEVVSVLVAGGAKPLDSVTQAQIRMIAAAERGDMVAVRKELTQGANVNRKAPTGETALIAAVKGGMFGGGNTIVVRELLDLGANPNLGGRFLIGESSPLHVAVFSNEKNFDRYDGPAVVDALLKAGADVSSVTFHRKQTPLHVAANLQNTKAAILLLKAGAKVTTRDEDGKTPLELAKSSAMIELLKSHDAKE